MQELYTGYFFVHCSCQVFSNRFSSTAFCFAFVTGNNKLTTDQPNYYLSIRCQSTAQLSSKIVFCPCFNKFQLWFVVENQSSLYIFCILDSHYFSHVSLRQNQHQKQNFMQILHELLFLNNEMHIIQHHCQFICIQAVGESL